MRELLLIKHAAPQIEPDRPAARWPLSEKGRAQSQRLAGKLRPYQPGVMVASEEAKAAETGRLAAEVLGIPFETAPGLHEHDRTGVPYYHDHAAFEQRIKHFFAQPDAVVLGRESAVQARARFAGALEQLLAVHPKGNLAVATHGTVITLLVAAHQALDSFTFWQRLTLPSVVVLALPGFGLQALITDI